MATAIQWFALFPMFRRHLKVFFIYFVFFGDFLQTKTNKKTQSMYYYNSLTIVMFIITSIILFSFSTAVGITYTISMLFLTFLCPFWLIWIQRYKRFNSFRFHFFIFLSIFFSSFLSFLYFLSFLSFLSFFISFLFLFLFSFSSLCCNPSSS